MNIKIFNGVKTKKNILLFFALIMLSLFFTHGASADGLVPCGTSTTPCTLCHLIIGIAGLVKWGLTILITAALVAIAIAGVMYVVSSGSETMMTQAKGFLSASLIGFAVVLGAWLLVYTTMNILAAKGNLGIGKDGANGSGGSFSFSCDTTSTALTGTTASDAYTQAACSSACETTYSGDSAKIATCKQSCSTAAGVGSTASTGDSLKLAECKKWCTDNPADNSTTEGKKYNTDCSSGCDSQFGTGSSSTGTTTGDKLSQSEAQSKLDSCGVKYASANTLSGLQDTTVQELCNYKSASGCSPLITNNGGTTGSHATTGSCNHSSGCKADLRLDSCNNNYIESNYTPISGLRSDGAKMYQAPDGSCYAKESDHWDISLKSCPPGRG